MQGADGLDDVIFYAVVQDAVGAQSQDQDLPVLVEAAQLQRLVERGHTEIAQTVFHHIFHHDDGAVAIAVGLDDGHGLHIGAQLLPQNTDVVFQVIQIDLCTGRTKVFHSLKLLFS